MSEKFDPYFEWLNITPAEQPADYYRLLGVKTFESDEDLIRDKADDQMLVVRRYQNGKHAKTSQRLLNEISAARSCLLNEKLRRIYDSKLKKILQEKKLPDLDSPGILLPEDYLPDDVDPFEGTANVDQDDDLLKPRPVPSSWPYILMGALISVMILGVIALIVMQSIK